MSDARELLLAREKATVEDGAGMVVVMRSSRRSRVAHQD
jgi:hypothetical protein